MLLLDLVGCPLHTIKLHVFRHSLVIGTPFFEQSLQITCILDWQFGHSFLFWGACQQLLKFVKAHTFCFYFGSMILILRFCQLGIDKLVDVGKVSIDMIVNNFTVNQRAFMTGFDASGVVQNFLTHSQQLNKRKSVRLIYITPNKMSKKLHYVRNWEGKIISASSFAE